MTYGIGFQDQAKLLGLSSYGHGGGCGQVTGFLDTGNGADVATGDDAAVYLLEPDRALVVTTDFFTPIVDDAFQFYISFGQAF